MQNQFSQHILQNDGLEREHVQLLLVLKQPEAASLSKRGVFPSCFTTVFFPFATRRAMRSSLGRCGLTCPSETVYQLSGSGVRLHTAHGLCIMQMRSAFICHKRPMVIGLCFLDCGTTSNGLLH